MQFCVCKTLRVELIPLHRSKLLSIIKRDNQVMQRGVLLRNGAHQAWLHCGAALQVDWSVAYSAWVH